MTTIHVPDSLAYASLGRRLLAHALDWALLCAVFFPVTYLVKGVWLMTADDHLWHSAALLIFDPLCGIFLAVIILYFVLLEGLTGRTPGKMLMRTRITRGDGSRIGMRESLIRNALRAVDGLFFSTVGIALILSSKTRQRFGDRVAGTFVIRVSPTHSS